MAEPEVVVVGSLNMDLVARAPRLPVPGETVPGLSFSTVPGGKGANQAVAASRLGARTATIGCVGDDAFGRQLLAGLEADRVDCRAVRVAPGQSSGVALIVADSYIARVNASYLLESELNEMADSQFVSENSVQHLLKIGLDRKFFIRKQQSKALLIRRNLKGQLKIQDDSLAASLLLEKFSASSLQDVTQAVLDNYYNENKSSFRLPFNSYFLNRITFSDRESAVMFRTEVIANGWQAAVEKFNQLPTFISIISESLIPEQDIYPERLIRALEGLYPLAISIVITDDKGYYTVVQLLEKDFQLSQFRPFRL